MCQHYGRYASQAIRTVSIVGLAVGIALSPSALEAANEEGELRVFSDPAFETEREREVMVTVFRGPEPVAQEEIGIDYNTGFDLEPGTYRVRWEGPGLKTIEKDGLMVFADQRRQVTGHMKKGSGMKVYTYSTKFVPVGLTNEEIETRIEQLRKEIQYLEGVN